MTRKSTQISIDQPPARESRRAPSPRNAAETRQRILDAARGCFSHRSYENVGIREIASEAGVDSALVNRYFGNKESLFAEVVQGAFDIEEHLPLQLADVGKFLVEQVLEDEVDTDIGSFNALKLLLLAAASPETASVVSDRFHVEFVQQLAKKLKGKDVLVRAALVASYVIGLATMRHLLKSQAFSKASRSHAVSQVSTAIQACIDNDGI